MASPAEHTHLPHTREPSAPQGFCKGPQEDLCQDSQDHILWQVCSHSSLHPLDQLVPSRHSTHAGYHPSDYDAEAQTGSRTRQRMSAFPSITKPEDYRSIHLYALVAAAYLPTPRNVRCLIFLAPQAQILFPSPFCPFTDRSHSHKALPCITLPTKPPRKLRSWHEWCTRWRWQLRFSCVSSEYSAEEEGNQLQ